MGGVGKATWGGRLAQLRPWWGVRLDRRAQLVGSAFLFKRNTGHTKDHDLCVAALFNGKDHAKVPGALAFKDMTQDGDWQRIKEDMEP